MVGVVWWFLFLPSSKDGLVKLWDLDTQHCFQTLVSHDREVWSFAVVGEGREEGVDIGRLVVTSGNTQPKVYQLTREELAESKVNRWKYGIISNIGVEAMHDIGVKAMHVMSQQCFIEGKGPTFVVSLTTCF